MFRTEAAVPFAHGWNVVDFLLLNAVAQHNSYLRRDELKGVCVPSEDYGVQAGLFSLSAQRAYDVIRLVALHFIDGYIKCLQHLPHQWKLGVKLRRGGRALCFVLFVLFVTKGGAFDVKGYGAMGRLPI